MIVEDALGDMKTRLAAATPASPASALEAAYLWPDDYDSFTTSSLPVAMIGFDTEPTNTVMLQASNLYSHQWQMFILIAVSRATKSAKQRSDNADLAFPWLYSLIDILQTNNTLGGTVINAGLEFEYEFGNFTLRDDKQGGHFGLIARLPIVQSAS